MACARVGIGANYMTLCHVKHFLTHKLQTEQMEPSETEQNSEEDTEEQDSIEGSQGDKAMA